MKKSIKSQLANLQKLGQNNSKELAQGEKYYSPDVDGFFKSIKEAREYFRASK